MLPASAVIANVGNRFARATPMKPLVAALIIPQSHTHVEHGRRNLALRVLQQLPNLAPHSANRNSAASVVFLVDQAVTKLLRIPTLEAWGG